MLGINNRWLGFFWWLSGKESTCQQLQSLHSLENEMATILAWEIPWTKGPGGLQSLGSQRVSYNQPHMHTASSMLEKVPCALEMVYSAAVGWSVLPMSIWSSLLELFKSSISLIFYPDSLPFFSNAVWKASIIIIESIFPHVNSKNYCFINSGALLLSM